MDLPQLVLFAADDGAFPRGPGLYFSVLKLLPVLLVYLFWVRICWWADQDAHELKLSHEMWNPILLGSGILGLVIVWFFPMFLLSFPILLALFLGPALAYINLRNGVVPKDERVLTKKHLLELAERYLKFKSAHKAEAEEKRIPITFIAKSMSAHEQDDGRVRRVEESKGYRAALEMVYEAITSAPPTSTWSRPGKT